MIPFITSNSKETLKSSTLDRVLMKMMELINSESKRDSSNWIVLWFNSGNISRLVDSNIGIVRMSNSRRVNRV